MTINPSSFRRPGRTALAAGLAGAIFALSACAAPSPAAPAQQAPAPATGARLNVVSTVSPVTNMIYNVGGDRINLTGIVPEGVNSHTFEPAPSDAKILAGADLIFINGLKLEEPTLRLAEANKKDGAEIVLLGDQTIKPEDYVFDFSFPKEEGSPNPHLWVNPILALRYAEIARDALARRDPVNAEYYAKNFEALKARIEALDGAIKITLATIPEGNRKLLTYHDSFAYFAPRYGMTVIGAIQPSDFAEPSAKEVADLITQLRENKIPAIFGSEVFPSTVLDQIGKEAGVKFIDTLRDDDLPGAPGEARHSYFGMMVENVATMARVLGGDPAAILEFDTSNVPGADAAVIQAQE